MLTFSLAVLVLAATPGPALLSIVAVGSAFGFKQGTRYVIGAIAGANIVILMVISGLAALLTNFPSLQALLTGLSLCYLTYVAWQIATAPNVLNNNEKVKIVGIADGIFIQLLNPKAYAVALALFLGFPFSYQSFAIETLTKLLMVNGIFIPAYALWLLLGVRLRALNLSPQLAKRLNQSLALSMLVAVVISGASII